MRLSGGFSPCRLNREPTPPRQQHGAIQRGLFSFGRSIINEVREFGLADTLANLRTDCAKALDNHVGLYGHADGWGHGVVVYARLPFTRLSTMLEWNGVSLGWGAERSAEGWDIHCARLKVSFCREQGEAYSNGWGAL